MVVARLRTIVDMSRFVAAGATDEPSKEDDEWAEAQRKIDATRQPKPRLGEQEDGKSLYDTLQANKGDTVLFTDIASKQLTSQGCTKPQSKTRSRKRRD